MIVTDELLKQRDTEAFLKFDSRFSTEFECLENMYVSQKTAVTLPDRWAQTFK